jgi:hypothetical protein
MYSISLLLFSGLFPVFVKLNLLLLSKIGVHFMILKNHRPLTTEHYHYNDTQAIALIGASQDDDATEHLTLKSPWCQNYCTMGIIHIHPINSRLMACWCCCSTITASLHLWNSSFAHWVINTIEVYTIELREKITHTQILRTICRLWNATVAAFVIIAVLAEDWRHLGCYFVLPGK